MAWIDDRIWCHPKLTDVSSDAYRAYVNSVAYSSGFALGGFLTKGQQATIGTIATARRELLVAGLWETCEDIGKGGIHIHDWDEHNGKRDARKAADRERKRQFRRTQSGQSAGTSAPNPQDGLQDGPQDRLRTSRGQIVGPAHVDRVTSDGSTSSSTTRAVHYAANGSMPEDAGPPLHLDDILKEIA